MRSRGRRRPVHNASRAVSHAHGRSPLTDAAWDRPICDSGQHVSHWGCRIRLVVLARAAPQPLSVEVVDLGSCIVSRRARWWPAGALAMAPPRPIVAIPDSGLAFPQPVSSRACLRAPTASGLRGESRPRYEVSCRRWFREGCLALPMGRMNIECVAVGPTPSSRPSRAARHVSQVRPRTTPKSAGPPARPPARPPCLLVLR